MTSLSRRKLLGALGAQGVLLMGRSALGAVESMHARGTAAGRPGLPRRGGQLSTRLTREYGLTHPFVGAGMAFVSGPELVAAVSNAGALGTLGVGATPAFALDRLIEATRSRTSGPFAVDLLNAQSEMGAFSTEEHITVCADHRVPVVVFFWGTPPRAWVERLHRAGSRVWMQVGSVAEALEAARVGVDGIICQGRGAGGHNRSQAPTLGLLADVRVVLGPSVMLLAAGGIAEGWDVAQALAAGAEGVWVGTRLVASSEAYAHAEYKRRIVSGAPQATVRTTLFGPEWRNQPIRVLRNRVVNRWAGREEQALAEESGPSIIGTTQLGGQPYEMPRFSAIVPTPDTQGDLEQMCLPAGEGTSRIRRIQPAADIVTEMMEQAADFLR